MRTCVTIFSSLFLAFVFDQGLSKKKDLRHRILREAKEAWKESEKQQKRREKKERKAARQHTAGHGDDPEPSQAASATGTDDSAPAAATPVNGLFSSPSSNLSPNSKPSEPVKPVSLATQQREQLCSDMTVFIRKLTKEEVSRSFLLVCRK